MAITVTWSDMPACVVLFLPVQQRSQIVNGAAALAQLAFDLGSGRLGTGRLTAIPIAFCFIHRAISLKKP